MIVRSGLCTSAQLGGFITTLPDNLHLNDTSIYTTPLKFSPGSFPSPTTPAAEPIPAPDADEGGELEGNENEGGEGGILEEEASPSWITDDRRMEGKRQWDIIESVTNGLKEASNSSADLEGEDGGENEGERQEEEGGGGAVYEVPTYTGPAHYKVPKTGYYCVGM